MRLRNFFSALLMIVAATLGLAQDRVVDHFDNSDTQATGGLRTLPNDMNTAPSTQIIAVALDDGVTFLPDGANDKKKPETECGPLISDLVAKGAKFEACELALRAIDLTKDKFVMDAGFASLGVGRIDQLQGQGYGYIRP